jgi:hypothetical protein
MRFRSPGFVLMLALSVTMSTQVHAQGRPDPAVRIAAQKEALAALAFMDGTWRGTAWTLLPTGEKHTITQTERVGPFLGGAVRVIEGRGYEKDGSVAFNAFGVVSFDPDKRAYGFRSHAMGYSGDYPFTVRPDGFEWEIKAGPMTMRYAATIKDGVWTEVGDRTMGDQPAMRFFEMTLHRIGDTDWPSAEAVPPGE